MSPWSSSASSFPSANLGNFYSRRLLLATPLFHPSSTGPPSPIPRTGTDARRTLESTGQNSFDANIVMILAVLLCALICALGLNWIVKCALRCSSRVGLESGEQAATRLANTGVKKKALKTFPTLAYSPGLDMPGLDSECVICLSEFAQGERVRVLPKCNHGFHVKCIDKWLISHSSCPTCRQCLLNTCQKIVGHAQVGSSDPQRIILPLDREDLLINYRALC
ncbi:RING-H2 finger protein ATL78-like protein [Cinnamomum micranthum f. kanehirae]|uniref:RING-H2 finger protein ATL78-like protein n=1 Tax=Cinnamomum micranthum f. kanehirae TaxID=337451 RepID=A0A3S4P3S4_9MAGN|nr:RING-H2 finger protein ATL78-like protein [Cinnamomum micranthum f. kanehirae]